MGVPIPKVTREWVKEEREIAERCGLDFWGSCGPVYFNTFGIRQAQLRHNCPDHIIEMHDLLESNGEFSFKRGRVLFNRYVRDLVSMKKKIVIHSGSFRVKEKKIYKSFGFKSFLYKQSEGRVRDQIIKRILDHE